MFRHVMFRHVAPTLILAALVPAQELEPRRKLPEAAIATFLEATGHEPFACFAAWTRGELAGGMELAFEERAPELDAAFGAAAVCGLWSDDLDVAFGAACHVQERQLDVRDIDRFVEVAMPHLFDGDLRFDFDVFKHVLSTAQVASVIASQPRWDSDVRPFFLIDLHRSMRAEHVPALCLRVGDDDPIVREQAFDVLANLVLYTDRYRENVALMLLAWPGESTFVVVDYDDPTSNPRYEPREFELGPATGGYSPILRAVLRRWFLGLEQEESREGFDAWLHRWANDEVPGIDDRELLLELLASPRQSGQWIALRGLRPFGGERDVRDAIARYESASERAAVAAAAAIVVRGGSGDLRERARYDAAALLAALDIGDAQVWRDWSARAFGEDPVDGLAALELLDDARDHSEYGPLLIPESARLSLRAAAADAQKVRTLDAGRLAFLAREFQECRTTALIAAYLAAIGPSELDDSAVAALELHDEAGFRAKLVGFAERESGAIRDAALGVLARLGAPEVGRELVEWAGGDPDRTFLLARSATSPAVHAFLVDRLRAMMLDPVEVDPVALAALAAASGVPEEASMSWADRWSDAPADALRARLPRVAELLIAGDGVGALAGSLDLTFGVDSSCDGLGLVEDPRVHQHLRRLRDEPGALVQDVIAELAIAGDSEAVAEMEEVRRRHLYGWMDDGGLFVRTLGPRLDLVPYWIGEIGTVCCRRNGAAWAVEELTGFDASSYPEVGLRTQRQWADAWWERVGPSLRWSRIAGRFAVAPH